MAKFNPMMLDASIRDVVSALSSEQKTDVLLYAMERIVSNPKARTTVENAASSAIQMSVARPDKAIQARLLRARARLAADLRGAAHKDLQEILEIDPHHPEASSLMPSSKALDRAPGQLQFMNEIWREIATYLSKRDLRAVLQVPHPLSSIASGLLFRTVNLHFGSLGDAKELDDWYARRSAEILNHLVLHPVHASCVHSLNIFASGGTDAYAFQLAIVENVLPKLVNLTALGCHFPGPAIQTLLRTVEKTGAKLKSLVLDPTSPLSGELPNFPLLTHFAYGGEKVECPAPAGFAHVLAGRSIVLRSLVLHNARFPLDGRVPLSNLMSLDLRLVVRDTTLLNTIFAEGRHLERLSLSIKLSRHEHVPLSETFRAHARALPALRGFALHIDGAPREPADLVPSITDFVMHHEKLRSLRVTHALGEHDEPSSSVIWSALPRLTELEVLSLDLPSEHVLASWLIPKSVECLHLRFVRPPSEGASLLAQLLPGLPRGLRMLSLPTINVSATLRDMLHTTLPELALLSLGGVTHSVSHAPQGIELERWSERRGRFYLSDLDGREGTSWVAGLPWHWR